MLMLVLYGFLSVTGGIRLSTIRTYMASCHRRNRLSTGRADAVSVWAAKQWLLND